MIQDWKRIQLGELSLHPADLLLIRGAIELGLLKPGYVWATLKLASELPMNPSDTSAAQCNIRLCKLCRDAWDSVSADEAVAMLEEIVARSRLEPADMSVVDLRDRCDLLD